MTAIAFALAAAMVMALVQRPPPALAVMTMTFNRCAITWSDEQQVNATIQCRRTEISATLNNYQVRESLWVNMTMSSQPIGRHGSAQSYSPISSTDFNFCEFIGDQTRPAIYADIIGALLKRPEHHLFDRCPIQPVRVR